MRLSKSYPLSKHKHQTSKGEDGKESGRQTGQSLEHGKVNGKVCRDEFVLDWMNYDTRGGCVEQTLYSTA